MELNPGRAAACRRRRLGQRRGETGLTLIELLVTLAILTVIGGALVGAVSVGLRLLGPTGAAARLTGSHDLLAFEQQIGADIARADCLAAPSQASIPSNGCTASTRRSPSSSCGSAYLLCLAWYVPGSSTCHTVTYTQTAVSDTIVRKDSTLTTGTRFSTGGLQVTPTWATVTTGNGYQWTKQVNVLVSQQGTPNAPPAHYAVATFHLTPLVVDPSSPVVAGGTPC